MVQRRSPRKSRTPAAASGQFGRNVKLNAIAATDYAASGLTSPQAWTVQDYISRSDTIYFGEFGVYNATTGASFTGSVNVPSSIWIDIWAFIPYIQSVTGVNTLAFKFNGNTFDMAGGQALGVRSGATTPTYAYRWWDLMTYGPTIEWTIGLAGSQRIELAGGALVPNSVVTTGGSIVYPARFSGQIATPDI